MNNQVALFQFILCVPLAYPSAMSIGLPLSELPTNIIDGFWCYLGFNSMDEAKIHAMNEENPGSGSNMVVDQCGMAPIYVSIYMVFNMAYNVLVILILKYGSANIMFLGSTALVPLTNALFAMDWVPGHKPLQVYSLFILSMVLDTYFQPFLVGFIKYTI
jgi:hypothetical protein